MSAAPTLVLPVSGGGLAPFALGEPRAFPPRSGRPFARAAFAAAHVVADPLADADPWLAPALDWEATLAFRRHLWRLGLGVAEAMDTAQRGMGLDWPASRELIRRTLEEARGVPGARVASGAGTDHLDPADARGLDDVAAAWEEQLAFIEGLGGQAVLMASRALAARASGPGDYLRIYDRILRQVSRPVIVHWLGDMFDPALAGYWGSRDLSEAMEVCLDVIAAHPGKVEGIKVSLLDKDREIAMRRRLPPSVRMFTGDDFAYAELIDGDAEGHSDALLGIFDPIAPAASAALDALAGGDRARFHDILAPTVALSRHMFRAPTRFYKTGVVFMAWLNGHQDHFAMVGGQQSARSILHMAELLRLADSAGLVEDPDMAAARMRTLLAVHGIAA